MEENKSVKFWGLLIMVLVAVSVLVLVIDISIKTSILEESTRLRGVIEEEYNDRARAEKNNTAGNSPDDSVNGSVHSDVLPDLPDSGPGEERADFPRGKEAATTRRRARPVSGGSAKVPGGDQ